MESRLFVSLAALAAAVAIAGCAGGFAHNATQATTSSTSTRRVSAAQHAREEREAQKIVRESEAEERQRAREQRHQERITAERERREEQRAQAERERLQSAPTSHEYPAAVRAAFLHGCETTSGHEDAACECAIKRIEAKVTLGRYRQNEAEVREGKPLPFIYNFEYGYCAGKGAVEGG